MIQKVNRNSGKICPLIILVSKIMHVTNKLQVLQIGQYLSTFRQPLT